MATNSTTWFYKDPEIGRAYLISERLTHTFWANRLSGIYLTCVRSESPFLCVGEWKGTEIEIEWETAKRFTLRTDKQEDKVIEVCREVLGFKPSVSYTDADGSIVTEWYTDQQDGAARLKEVQGNPAYRNVRRSG